MIKTTTATQNVCDKVTREERRAHYRSEMIERNVDVKVLFVGESPHFGDKTFFYCASGNLYKNTLKAFAEVYGKQLCGEGEQFLKFFSWRGCYLDDLCLDPVDCFDKATRKQMRRQSEASLAERIGHMEPKPLQCIVVMKGIEKNVRSTLQQAGTSTIRFRSVTFPRPEFGHSKKYVQEMIPILQELIKKGVLDDPKNII